DPRIIDARPARLLHGLPAAEGVQPPFQHPRRLFLFGRDETDGVFVQPLRGLLGFDDRLESIAILINVDLANLIDRFLNGWHFILRSRFQAPRWITRST